MEQNSCTSYFRRGSPTSRPGSSAAIYTKLNELLFGCLSHLYSSSKSLVLYQAVCNAKFSAMYPVAGAQLYYLLRKDPRYKESNFIACSSKNQFKPIDRRAFFALAVLQDNSLMRPDFQVWCFKGHTSEIFNQD